MQDDNLDNTDQLRQGVGLQACGNITHSSYTKEGFDMFEEMSHSIQEDTIRYLNGQIGARRTH